MRYSVETDYKLLLRNIVQYRWFIAIMFSVIAIAFTVLGYFAPKKYTSYATLLLDSKTVIQPLIPGAPDTGAATNWGDIADEIVHSRKTLTKLMQSLGYIDDEIRTVEDEIIKDQLERNIKVSLDGSDKYLKIEFSDPDPYFAKEVATRLTDIFIAATHGYRARESEEAFEFIDQQVKEYHRKLQEAERRLKEFKTFKLSSGASSELAVNQRLERLQATLDQAQLDLKEALIQKASLERQLNGEIQQTVSLARQSQYLDRLTKLEDRLAQLRLTYHENYPDIVQIKYQIEDLKRAIEREKRNKSMDLAGVSGGIKANKVYQDIRLQLSEVETRIATLTTRINEVKKNIELERQKGRLVNDTDAKLAELTRDYEVNKRLYEELLRKREGARVSKEIDEQHKGLNIKIYQPAFLPAAPSGFRFIHFVLMGLVLGLLVPVALIYVYQLLDNTIKSAEMIQAKLGLSVLGDSPDIINDDDLAHMRRSRRLMGMLVGSSFVVMVAIGYLKFIQADV